MAGAGVWTSAAGRDMRALLRAGSMAGLDDPQLLARFLGGGPDVAELAFAALVHRHGGLVLRACRDVLADSHAAEDAAQAVFLVLARRAGSIHKADSLACWLFGVSLRVARRMRHDDARRRVREARGAELAAARRDGCADDFAGLYEELDNLPERYRRPLILCHLEGLTHQQAAEQLGCPPRTIHTRLTRGKARLRDRLIRRGLAPATGLLTGSASFAASPCWCEATAVAAIAFSKNGLTTPSALLARGVLAAMTASKIKTAALVAGLACALLLGSLPAILKQSAGANPSPIPPKPIPQSEPAKPAQKTAPSRAAEITVLDAETGKPIAGATVSVSVDFHEYPIKTDAAGVAKVDLSKRRLVNTFGADVWADGYVQQRLNFADTQPQNPLVTQHYDFRLHRGSETFGGTVKDEQGKPIAGAEVALWGYLGEMKDKKELAFKVAVKTDEQGRWRCGSLRKMSWIALYVSHPDFLTDDWRPDRHFGRSSGPTDPKALDPLRDFSAVQVMARGVSVKGRVTDEEGDGIGGALITSVDEKNRSTLGDDLTWTTADAKGQFTIPHARPGGLMLVAKANGRAPEILNVQANAEVRDADISLKPAKVIAGRVVDGKGKPIEGAFVNLSNWRGFRGMRIYLATDKDGRFRWDQAPADAVLATISAEGLMGISQLSTLPGDDHVFTLRRSLDITGTVRDIHTKKKVLDRCELEVGIVDPKTGGVAWGPSPTLGGGMIAAWVSDGALLATLDAESPATYQLRLKYRGYEPFVTQSIQSDEGKVTIDVALARPEGKPIEGVVLGPDGKPVAGADVSLSGPGVEGAAQLKEGKFAAESGRNRQAVQKVATGADGRFILPPSAQVESPRFAFVAVHDTGFAVVKNSAFETDSTIRLKPWGRIEGVVKVGAKPVANRPVRYSLDGGMDTGDIRVYGEAKAKTDKDGRFAFDRVAPGDVRVMDGDGFGGDLLGTSYGILVEVKPGQMTRAEIGGTGRPMVARVATPEGFDPKLDYAAYSEYDLLDVRPLLPPTPKEMPGPNFNMDRINAWSNRWHESPEGKAYRRSLVYRYRMKLGPGGTIRVDDLPAGEYVLKLTYSADSIAGRNASGDRVAHATRQFTIPEIPGGRTDEPLDLGIIRPEPKGK